MLGWYSPPPVIPFKVFLSYSRLEKEISKRRKREDGKGSSVNPVPGADP